MEGLPPSRAFQPPALLMLFVAWFMPDTSALLLPTIPDAAAFPLASKLLPMLLAVCWLFVPTCAAATIEIEIEIEDEDVNEELNK